MSTATTVPAPDHAATWRASSTPRTQMEKAVGQLPSELRTVFLPGQ